MVEIAARIDPPAILSWKPCIVAAHLDLADLVRLTLRSVRPLHLDVNAGNRPAERSWFDHKVRGPGVIGENHADLGRSVHTAQRHPEGRLNVGSRFLVDR